MADPQYIPTEEELQEAGALKISDGQGQEVPFASIYATQKTIVVFIRHFFCGRCQEYVEALAKVPKETLEASNVQVVVIGCGNWQPITKYAQNTGFRGAIYTDPTRKLYHTLRMNIETVSGTPSGEKKRSYIHSTNVGVTMSSIWKGPLTNPDLIGKQGNISQLGGEFVFGPGNTCLFASRMQHTEDHVEVDDLLKAAGVPES